MRRAIPYKILLAPLLAAFMTIGVAADVAGPQPGEPIAFVGHGAFFDSNGREISPTDEFLQQAYRWYSNQYSAGLGSRARGDMARWASNLKQGLALNRTETLFADQVAFNRAFERSVPAEADKRVLGKLRALEYRLRRKLLSSALRSNFFVSAPKSSGELLRRVDELDNRRKLNLFALATDNRGKEYIDECAAAGVPIPPAIGQMESAGTIGWKSRGFLQPGDQFIVQTLAEIRTFENDKGMCYALPRYSATDPDIVELDGVICLSKTTSKSCFWDNQMEGRSFSFPKDTKIPIGYPDLNINPDGIYQAGGAELDADAGGVCTDCHAGENPYILHPRVDIGGGVTWGSVQDSLPAFAPEFHKPLAPNIWPANTAPEDDANVPPVCAACHSTNGDAGRFPRLSQGLKGYCGTILENALERTMPPRNRGSQVGKPEIVAFLDLCKRP